MIHLITLLDRNLCLPSEGSQHDVTLQAYRLEWDLSLASDSPQRLADQCHPPKAKRWN